MLQNSLTCPLTLYDGLLAQWWHCLLFLGVSSFGVPACGDGPSEGVQALARVALRLGFAAVRRSSGGLVLPER
jgi:hypothetical protein